MCMCFWKGFYLFTHPCVTVVPLDNFFSCVGMYTYICVYVCVHVWEYAYFFFWFCSCASLTVNQKLCRNNKKSQRSITAVFHVECNSCHEEWIAFIHTWVCICIYIYAYVKACTSDFFSCFVYDGHNKGDWYGLAISIYPEIVTLCCFGWVHMFFFFFDAILFLSSVLIQKLLRSFFFCERQLFYGSGRCVSPLTFPWFYPQLHTSQADVATAVVVVVCVCVLAFQHIFVSPYLRGHGWTEVGTWVVHFFFFWTSSCFTFFFSTSKAQESNDSVGCLHIYTFYA